MTMPGFWTTTSSEPVFGWVAIPPLVVCCAAAGLGVGVADGRFWVITGFDEEMGRLACEVDVVGVDVIVTTFGLPGLE